MSDTGSSQHSEEWRPWNRWATCRWILLPASILVLTMTWTTVASSSGAAATVSQPITLAGAGSTFDAPFFKQAFPAYHRMNPAVSIKYSAVGSTAGISTFSANQVAFGASDVPMTAAEQMSAQGGPSVQVPVDLGAEVLIYNLPGTPTGIHLTGSVIADIFRGQVTSWDAPEITALNHGIDIPWPSDHGGPSVRWEWNHLHLHRLPLPSRQELGVQPWCGPQHQLASGLRRQWQRRGGCIGRAHTRFDWLRRTVLQPQPALRLCSHSQLGGSVREADPEQYCGGSGTESRRQRFELLDLNELGSKSYPIVGYSWALVYQHQDNAASGTALVQMLNWLTSNGQVYAAKTGYVPLPSNIRALARTTLQRIVGPSGYELLLAPS